MMKKYFFISFLFPLPLIAQISVMPFAGLNSTKMTQAYSGYAKGGNYGILGAEVELVLKSKPYAAVNFSFVSGLSYLANGFQETTNFSIGTSSYSYQSSTLQMKYWQVPLIVRINWRPFPLVEDWRLFLGAGVSYNTTAYAHLAEQATNVAFTFNQPLYPPPVAANYSDSRDVTSLAVKNPLFERFDLGMKFKHFQVTYRLSVSLQDMYFKGIEKTWQVPATESIYINAHNSRGITKEKYSEIVFGWRLP
jgi:hypothetical protein